VEGKITRKILIPFVILLTFTILSTSVSATVFYKVHLFGHAIGDCNVSVDVDSPNYPGEGRLHLNGLAIARHGIGCYEVFPELDPGVYIRMGVHIKVQLTRLSVGALKSFGTVAMQQRGSNIEFGHHRHHQFHHSHEFHMHLVVF